jgi:hypothetical protein
MRNCNSKPWAAAPAVQPGALNGHSEFDGTEGAVELEQRTISHHPENLTAIGSGGWVDQLVPQPRQRAEHGRLVLSQQQAVINHIGRNYRGESALHERTA